MKPMLLAIDVGNTQTVLGVFHHERLVAHWRLATQQERTADELGILFLNLLQMGGIDWSKISRAIVACVVPSLFRPLEIACKDLLKISPLLVKPGIRTGMPLLVENPQEIGADRIANSVGAIARYGSPAIVVDFGTATTFDVITIGGEYAGGLIAPGLKISADALFSRAARLPRIELTKPDSLIGRSTIESMRSGIFYGYLGLLDGILEKLLAEFDQKIAADRESAAKDQRIIEKTGLIRDHLVATGGLAGMIVPHSRHNLKDDTFLTLHGLRILDEKNTRN